MMNRANRRGVMYTIIALLMLIVVANVFFTQSRRTGREAQFAVAERVQSVNAFIANLDQDSQRAAYIAGFRTMISMEQYVTSTGAPITDVGGTFRDIFLNGSYSNVSFLIMQNATFDDYLARVAYDASLQGISFNATVTNVTLWQSDPWSVLINYTMQMNVSDNRGTARWSLERTFIGKAPIIDLRDPFFAARTYGRIQRVIKPTNVTTFVNDVGDANDTTGLRTHFNSSYYIASGRGPDILMRFNGTISDSPFGIESFVDTDEFIAQSLPANTTHSVVDYLYFNGTLATFCTIQNMPSTFKLDTLHATTYQVWGRLTNTTC